MSKEELNSLNEDFSYIDESEREYYDVNPYDDEGNAIAAGSLISANKNILKDLNLFELASDVSKICDKELIDAILGTMKEDGTYKQAFDNLSLKELLKAAEFDVDQINEIRYGLENGLSVEQISVYARPEFEWQQMFQIRQGFENGLTQEQIALYADPKFDWRQMFAIETGFEHGLSIEQVSLYANPEFSLELMDNFREALEKEYLKDNSLDSMINDAREECRAENVNITAQRDTQEKTAPGDDGAI